MIRVALALALALTATPTLAQDQVPYDPQILNTCLEMGRGEDCAGIGAQRCMAEEGFYTTVGMGACLRAETEHWDEMLNDAYLALADQVGREDAELNELDSAAPRQEPALVDMQRKWIGFRDATCTYEATRWGGGTGASTGAGQCLLDLTARQTLWLRTYLRPADDLAADQDAAN